MYTDVPVGLYTVQVKGNDEYQPTVKRINIINEEEKESLTKRVNEVKIEEAFQKTLYEESH